VLLTWNTIIGQLMVKRKTYTYIYILSEDQVKDCVKEKAIEKYYEILLHFEAMKL
jgi:hypothetical protein